MASITNSVWAIDIGSNSLKALRLTDVDGVIEVIDFDEIEHGKILTGKGVQELERDELIALTLRQFVQNHELDKDDVIISLPSQNSFARFVNLPPVEPKKIPEIIRFEAVQQIPFDINDVQWDWQLMEEEKGGEKKVGIFAIKNDIINYMLDHFSRENIQVKLIQMAPMALYNYVVYDRSDMATAEDNQAIAILNMGAEYTDLVICAKTSVWQRCIPMGGNSFTKAISDAFKINFEKAEKLKRNATTSKYARQILQAMKQVFTDLASEVQRSIGFYSSSNPNTTITKIVAIGGATKMRGLLKYMQQSLQIPVERPETFEKLAVSQDIPAAKFHDSVCNLAVAYGLGVQALGMGKIESNLLPRAISRSIIWESKSKYFITAAALLMLVSVLSFGRVLFDKAAYRSKNTVRQDIKYVIDLARNAADNLKKEKDRETVSQAIIDKELDLFSYRQVIPQLMQIILSALPNEKNNPEQADLYKAFRQGNVQELLQIERKERKQIFITGMSIRFTDDIAYTGFTEQDMARRSPGSVSTTLIRDKTADQQQFMEEMIKKRYGIDVEQRPSDEEALAAEDAGQQMVTTGPKESKTGFVVTIVGYSPYKDYEQLLDPPGVGQDIQKWGFVTRLKNIKEYTKAYTDGNCPFEVFDVTDRKHIDLAKDVVALDARMPAGIGIEDQKVVKGKRKTANTPAYRDRLTSDSQQQTIEQVLIDPMTKEIISRVRKYNEDGTAVIESGRPSYEVNDHWFELKIKFRWLEAPEKINALVSQQ